MNLLNYAHKVDILNQDQKIFRNV